MGLMRTAMAGGRADLLAAAALTAGVAAVALAGWRAAVLWREAGPRPAPPPGAATPSPPAPPALALDAGAAGLFGRVPARASAPPPAALPETRARLRLYGIAVPARGEPLALVGGPGRPTRLVRAGDRLGGRLRIEAIGPDGVVLLRDGRRERLALPRASLATAARAPAAPAVRLVPWRKGGRLAGLRVAALPAEVAARTGLRPGDVITAVDGMPLVAPEEARLVAEALRLPRPPRLEVLRGGARLELGGGKSGRREGG